MATRITQAYVEALTTSSDAKVRITQEYVEVLVVSRILTPEPASAVSMVIEPTVIEGAGVSVTPGPATVAAASVAPTFIYGSLTATPAPRSVDADALIGNVLAGSITVSPTPASADTTVNGPVLSVVAQPAPADAGTSTTRTEVIIAYASASADAVDPAVILSSLSFAPASSSAVATVVNPTVIGGDTFTPAYAYTFMVA